MTTLLPLRPSLPGRASVPCTGDLHPALTRLILGRVPGLRSVRSLSSRMSPYSTRFHIDDIGVALADGSHRRLILKDLRVNAMLPGARAILGERPARPLIEINVYRHLLPLAPAGPPALVASCSQPGEEWLLLEAIDGYQLRHVGDLNAWAAVAAWIGRLHARFSAGTNREAAAEIVPMRHEDRLIAPWGVAIARLRDAGHPDEYAAADLLERCSHIVVDHLSALPPTLTHGQLYASNVVIADSGLGNPPRLGVVDWETAGIGAGVLDLAALVEGWDPRTRATLEDAYRNGLASAGGNRIVPDPTELSSDVSAARLQLCVELLALPESFDPPADQAKDWLGLAVSLAGELER